MNSQNNCVYLKKKRPTSDLLKHWVPEPIIRNLNFYEMISNVNEHTVIPEDRKLYLMGISEFSKS